MDEEKQMEDIIENMAVSRGFTIIKGSHTLSPDMVIEIEGKRIGIELKHAIVSGAISSRIGQLLFGKVAFGLDEMWLVFPKGCYGKIPISWFRTLQHVGIVPFHLGDEGFVQIEEKDCEQWGRVEWLKHHLKRSGKL